ncbi:protein O-linked-mannose beta-1,2-N-acetylglucosaminyltransferase 1-like isoform X2 [Ornithodoros turicata]
MTLFPRLVRFLCLKWTNVFHSKLKLVLILCILYFVFRQLISLQGLLFSSHENGTHLLNTTGWDQTGATKLTGFLNALKADSEHETVHVVPAVAVGERVPHCGLASACPKRTFSVHVFTGKDHHDEPRLCIDGKYILGGSLNGGGRGINIAIVDNLTRFVQRVSHFDTYEEDSSQLETLLLNLRPGDILILLTFDEPTRKSVATTVAVHTHLNQIVVSRLSQVARLLLHELGSAMAQNLHYRSSWYLITQKGISGFTPYEDLHFVESKGWPVPHDVRHCIPFHLGGQAIHPDPQPRRNDDRRQFCSKYDHFPSFCSGDKMDNPLVPNPAVRFSKSKVLSLPVIVLSGDDVSHFPLTLETLIMQPGINPHNVLVFFNPENPQVKELCELFAFTPQQFNGANVARYCDQMNEAFDTGERQFPDSMYFVVIEDGVLLAPDFLMYLAPLVTLLDKDSTISSISAWNDNGFEGVSGNNRRMYRVETLSGFGFVVRRGFPVQDWCEHRLDHSASEGSGGDTISPDVSRVLRLPILDIENGISMDILQALMARKRVTDMDVEVALEAGALERAQYERYLEETLKNSLAWEWSKSSCLGLQNTTPPSNTLPLAIYFDESSENEYTVLRELCYCFGLFHHPKNPPRGLYRGMLRFFWKNHDVLLIGKTSPYYRFKPRNVVPLSLK